MATHQGTSWTPTRRRGALFAPITAGLTASTVLAQAEMVIEVDRPTLRPGERATITVLAAFPTQYYAFAFAYFDLITSVGSDGFSDPTLFRRMRGPGTTPGVLSPTGVDGIISAQLNFPVLCTPGPCADISNPATLWTITYIAPIVVAEPFLIDLETVTETFGIYEEFAGTVATPLEPTEGAAVIRVLAGCYADCDESGALDLFDFLCYQSLFAAGDPFADCDGSSALDFFDFLCFQNLFNAGCP